MLGSREVWKGQNGDMEGMFQSGGGEGGGRDGRTPPYPMPMNFIVVILHRKP